ncbi:hypothetical protein IP91_00328 [Pseudoduganella lurida]|uniref:Uncharacterized protein n=1 Tax=Pseudoduganella lurida TaxID=1036180 RepID=A0A562RJS4_9BURK|nr:hypothetical protein [Pseudoduganella lurida]TWI69261.1 hypothetical protein IP91_00328 [Pseudoduganella lurida]
MNTDINDFLARRQRTVSKLAPWLEQIIALRKSGASYRCICSYLAEQGVTARNEEVIRFLRRRDRARLRTSSPTKPQPRPPAPKPVLPDGIPVFKWEPAGKSDNSW